MPSPPYRYDPIRDRYRDARGRYVRRVEVRSALDAVLDGAGNGAGLLSEALRAGRLALAEWQMGMIRVIKTTHLQATAAARGGWDQLSPADYGRAGAAIKGQYQYLRKFAAEVEGGRYPLDGRFVRRAKMYGEASRAHFHDVEREQMRTRGVDEERNLQTSREGCGECNRESRRLWVPIGTLKKIGRRECLTSCRCFIQYRNSTTNEIEA